MDPIKYAIKLQLVNKCTECQDLSFCKLPSYYQQLDKPDIRDLDKLKKCIFFKRKATKLQLKTSWL